jgi:hypothetical protein
MRDIQRSKLHPLSFWPPTSVLFFISSFFVASLAHLRTMKAWCSVSTAVTRSYPSGRFVTCEAAHTRLTACDTAPLLNPSAVANPIWDFPSTNTPRAISMVCCPTSRSFNAARNWVSVNRFFMNNTHINSTSLMQINSGLNP